jgi:NitT/TauT family transport system permease protein
MTSPPRWAVSCLSVASVLAAWELAPRAGLVDVTYLSQPSLIVRSGIGIIATGALWRHAAVSLQEFFAGLLLALLIGVPGGLALGSSRRMRRFLDPPIMALYAAPRLALLPVLVVWLGIGLASKVAVVFIGAVLPIVINGAAGIREVEASLVLAARSLGAHRIDLFTKVLLPGSLPAVMAGVRLGVGRGILGVVVGEMYVSQVGIGNQIMQLGSSFQIDQLLFYTMVVSVFGLAATTAVRRLEERWRPWSRER